MTANEEDMTANSVGSRSGWAASSYDSEQATWHTSKASPLSQVSSISSKRISATEGRVAKGIDASSEISHSADASDVWDATSRDRILTDQWLDDHFIFNALFAFNPDPRIWYIVDPLSIQRRGGNRSTNRLRGWAQQRNVLLPVSTSNHWSLAFVERVESKCTMYDSLSSNVHVNKAKCLVDRFLHERGLATGSLAFTLASSNKLVQPNLIDCGLYVILHALHLMHHMPLRRVRPASWRRLLLPLFSLEASGSASSVAEQTSVTGALDCVDDSMWAAEDNLMLMGVAEKQIYNLQSTGRDQVHARELEAWLKRAPQGNPLIDGHLEETLRSQSLEAAGILGYAPQVEQATARISRILQNCRDVHIRATTSLRKMKSLIDNTLTEMERFSVDSEIDTEGGVAHTSNGTSTT